MRNPTISCASGYLFRIQNPPMGGSEADYVRWAMAVPGVTRAWAAVEQGIGTMTVRFLMDDMYPDNYGLPTAADIQEVALSTSIRCGP